MYEWSTLRGQKDIGHPETEVTGGCEPPDEGAGMNPGPCARALNVPNH